MGAIQAYGSSAPSKAPLVLYVHGSHNGSTWSYTTHSMISIHRIAAKGADLALSRS